MGQNLIEKIAQKYTVGETGKAVSSGDYITIKPEHIMTHDNTGAVIPKFWEIGATKMHNPRQPVYALDHNVQDKSETNLKKYANIQAFAKDMGVDFYPAGRGIGHQIMCEEGYAWPATMMVASDSHSNMYGGLGCLGTPIVRTDAAGIWATGKTWWQIPPVAKVILTGELKPGVSGKDVIIALCGTLNNDEVLNHAIEFSGPGVKKLSIDQRLTIANMTTEWGALTGVFPTDETTFKWLENRIRNVSKRGLAGVPSDADSANDESHPRLNMERFEKLKKEYPMADSDAQYAKTIEIDLSSINPLVAGPNSVKVMTAVAGIRKKKVKVDKAYLVSCVNSRVEDIAEAASVVRGNKIAPGVEFYIAAASSEVQAESEKRGDWQALLDAGAKPLPPGCGPCIGLGAGLLEENEVGISATNRNFKGRMGAASSQAYLASPRVVAASALAGYIDVSDSDETDIVPNTKIEEGDSQKQAASVDIYPGFPEILEGDLVFCHEDNLNTDGIYPGKYTYKDDMTLAEQGEVVMENYDPEFRNIAKKGDVVAGGFNFGSGSSREQAATALAAFGIKLVIAGSFSATYQRNAINNGFGVIASPNLVNYLKKKYGAEKPTVQSNQKTVVDFKNAILEFNGQKFSFAPLGAAAQEIIVAGGLQNWVKAMI